MLTCRAQGSILRCDGHLRAVLGNTRVSLVDNLLMGKLAKAFD